MPEAEGSRTRKDRGRNHRPEDDRTEEHRSPEEKHLFICDVHLGGFDAQTNRQIERDLIRLIDYAESRNMRLWILGDLFDYWMEYPGHTPDVGSPVISRLARHIQTHGPLLYITGNHDCWTLDHFPRLGFDVEHEMRRIELNGCRTLLLHGDGLADPATRFPRPVLHRVLKNPYFLKVYRTLLPPRAGIALTRWFSRVKRMTRRDHRSSDRALREWAHRQLRDDAADAVVCGHHHNPVIQRLGDKIYLNPGNFFKDRMAGFYTNQQFQLVQWFGADNKLITINTSPEETVHE